ncbi:hypothetical protein F4818DRAFT_75379 [Hypoxylon cercidicola]|nr:hypothetical protein F4818DRAFT_75379 [Hypoxylon cercidicola]
MADQRVPTPTGSRSTVRRTLRSSSQSPARPQHRLGDDLLSQLSPNVAVDALRSPTGALKICMDQASASEQAFAMKAAIASKKIREWLEEVSGWLWPRNSGSAGFEMSPAKRRKLSQSEAQGADTKGKLAESDLTPDSEYLGSLPAAVVDHYEKRVEQIQLDLDDLDLEEIKSQVLHNHIFPLSRPGSPFSESGRSATSTSMFAKLEDLTAVVTAITVQALPNLSRLSRLLNTWSVRLLVLRKVPLLLKMITDAQVTLRSGWSAIESAEANLTESNGHEENNGEEEPSGLSRKDFEVMKRVIQQKVTKPGRALDYMLDLLEGSSDTLPDDWLDEMEALERDYALWETTAEHKVRMGESSSLFEVSPKHIYRTEPETPQPKIQIQGPSPTKDDFSDSPDVMQFASPPTPSDYSPETGVDGGLDTPSRKPLKEELGATPQRAAVKILVDESDREIPGSTQRVMDSASLTADRHDIDAEATGEDFSFNYDSAQEKRPPTAKPAAPKSKSVGPLSNPPHLSRPKQSASQTYHGPENLRSSLGGQTSVVLGEVDQNIIRNTHQESKKPDVVARHEPTLADEPEASVLEPSVLEPVDEEGEELELPPARFLKHVESKDSFASTVIHGPPGGFLDHSDNASFREGSMEPDLPRLPDPDEPFSSDAISPPSSPPLRRGIRSASVTFKDVPEIAMLPEASSSPPRSPLGPPAIFDVDTSFEYESQVGSPGRMSSVSSNSEDEQFQQQITEILQSIPAKIRFERKPRINLNPPDLNLPPRPKSKTDTTLRSNSSMSSRAGTPFSRSGTPAFMLAPAKENRPRSKSSQGIRVYNLTRSGEPPLKLLIRSVGEKGERVMVRIGGGWADLGEYLREYAIHHSSRSKGEGLVDVKDVAAVPGGLCSSPSSRPASAMGSPVTPLAVRKTRKSLGEEGAPKYTPKTPFPIAKQESDTPSSETSAMSRSSSRMDWDEEDSALGLAGPKGKKVDMNDESRKWVESVKEKVRIASGERPPPDQRLDTKFGEISKVGGTKRLFRKR